MSTPSLRFLVYKAGAVGPVGLRAQPAGSGVEAWECGTSPSSGKSCGVTCGYFSDRGRGGGCSLLIPLSLPQWTARGGEMVLPNGAAGWEGACGCVGDWGLCRGRVIQILPRWNKNASFPGSSSLGQEKEALGLRVP